MAYTSQAFNMFKTAGKFMVEKGGSMPGRTKLALGGFAVDTALNAAGGDNLGTAATKASVIGIMVASNPVIFGLGTLGGMGVEAGWEWQKFKHQKSQWWNSQYAYNNNVGGNYIDTQRAQTMRQAAVMAIQGSKLNARSALGGEAKIMSPYSQRR